MTQEEVIKLLGDSSSKRKVTISGDSFSSTQQFWVYNYKSGIFQGPDPKDLRPLFRVSLVIGLNSKMDRLKIVYLDNIKTPIETPFYEKNWFKALSRLINIFIRMIPPLRRLVAKSIPNLSKRIQKLYREGNYIEALELSILGVTKCERKNVMYDWYWWIFMSYAVYCADCLNNTKIMNILISITEKSSQPDEGSSAGYCYCRFSHFKYAQKDYASAIRFADLAKNADDKSGEAYYLLGFYELFINEGDPMAYFSAAIERDQEILGWIAHHPSLKEYPGIINELRQLKIINSKPSPNILLNPTADAED